MMRWRGRCPHCGTYYDLGPDYWTAWVYAPYATLGTPVPCGECGKGIGWREDEHSHFPVLDLVADIGEPGVITLGGRC